MLYLPTCILNKNMYLINKQKIELLDPKEFGLSSRTLIGRTKEGTIILLKDRKSRIIMKDGRIIFDQIKAVEKSGEGKMALGTNAPICSKTTKFFKENKIDVYSLEKQNV